MIHLYIFITYILYILLPVYIFILYVYMYIITYSQNTCGLWNYVKNWYSYQSGHWEICFISIITGVFTCANRPVTTLFSRKCHLQTRHLARDWGCHTINGHVRNLSWRYLPYRRPIEGLCKGISPQNMANNMVQYLHFSILKFPLILVGLFMG